MGYFFRFELPLGAFSPLPVAVGSSDCYDVQAAGFLVIDFGEIVIDFGEIVVDFGAGIDAADESVVDFSTRIVVSSESVVAAGFLVVDFGAGIDAASESVLLISENVVAAGAIVLLISAIVLLISAIVIRIRNDRHKRMLQIGEIRKSLRRLEAEKMHRAVIRSGANVPFCQQNPTLSPLKGIVQDSYIIGPRTKPV